MSVAAFTISSADIVRCPKHSLSPGHYRPHGGHGCYCDEADALRAEIAELRRQRREAMDRIHDLEARL